MGALLTGSAGHFDIMQSTMICYSKRCLPELTHHYNKIYQHYTAHLLSALYTTQYTCYLHFTVKFTSTQFLPCASLEKYIKFGQVFFIYIYIYTYIHTVYNPIFHKVRTLCKKTYININVLHLQFKYKTPFCLRNAAIFCFISESHC